MNKTLPKNGLAALARAAFTIGRKARPLQNTFEQRYVSDPINMEHVQRYKTFIGFSDTSPIPLSYFYLFAQRAQLSMMMNRCFTYPVPGLVHMANSMQLLEPIDHTLAMDVKITVEQENADQTGRLCISFVVTIEQLGILRMRCNSRYLGKRGDSKDTVKTLQQTHSKLERFAEWVMPHDLGRRYAALSGDYNPIHLWPWSARIFGFGKPIVQGMYSVAKIQALLEKKLGMQVSLISATFVKPALLPGHMYLEVAGNDFRLMSDEKIVVLGCFDAA